MAKRRKLSKDYEKKISASLKQTELILAKINDIVDDDIRVEYTLAFAPIKALVDKMNADYKQVGYTSDSDIFYNKYINSIEHFQSEYEI